MSELRIERKPGTIHVVVTAVMSGLIAVIGYMTHMFLPHFVISIWPTTGLFAVAGIWFGAAQSVSTIFQALIPAWAFRRFKANPGLKTSRDGHIFMIWANIIPGFVSTLIGPTIWYFFGLVPNLDSLFFILMPGWFISNVVITPLVGMPLLKATSDAVMKSRAYVKRWLA